MRDDNKFNDVTLASEDGQLVEAHKVILAGCSPQTNTPTLLSELTGSSSNVENICVEDSNCFKWDLFGVGSIDNYSQRGSILLWKIV